MKDYTLSILLATQTALGDQQWRQGSRQVFYALLHVLMLCGDSFPDALARVVLPVIDRSVHVEI